MSQTPSTPPGLRIGHVRGVVLHKWQRTWEERFRNPLTITEVTDDAQLAGLHDGSLDMCFVRLPIDRDGLHAIPLYEEQMVAWVAKDHLFAAADELTSADLADEETVLTELDAVAVDRVLAGAVLVVPMSIARGASRRDLVYRPVVDAETSPVALAWRTDDDNLLLDEFVGVVRGRSANSSRTQKERAASGSRPVKARPQPRKQRPQKGRRGR
ncbi:LysR substrate-binding domain-containing protein [Mariniluteicoccus endophyticus]